MNNHRSVTFLENVCKIFERFMYDHEMFRGFEKPIKHNVL